MDRLELFLRKTTPGENGCLLWTGARNDEGYGSFGIGNRKTTSAHRFSYTTFVGPIPPKMQIDHLCRVRNCVEPRHLEVVTQQENIRRGMTGQCGPRGPRVSHCVHGHAYTEENTYTRPGSTTLWRECRTCRRERDAR